MMQCVTEHTYIVLLHLRISNRVISDLLIVSITEWLNGDLRANCTKYNENNRPDMEKKGKTVVMEDKAPKISVRQDEDYFDTKEARAMRRYTLSYLLIDNIRGKIVIHNKNTQKQWGE